VLKLTNDTLALTGQDALVSFDGYTNTIDKVKYVGTRCLYSLEQSGPARPVVDPFP